MTSLVSMHIRISTLFFFFNDTATTEIYTPFPTRRSSDLQLLFSPEPSRRFDLRVTGRPLPILQHPCHVVADDAVDRKSTRLNSSHSQISYAVFCLKKKHNPHTK